MYAKLIVTLLMMNIHIILISAKNHTIAAKVNNAGFTFEEYKITTADGYINTAWRIPGRINETLSVQKKPVMLQHGILDDSWTFFALNTQDCLPIMLAEEGYDVWITNSRGNIFSNEHIEPDYKSELFFNKYWDFSFYELAKYDLPAYIDYIRNKTGFEKIIYVGHSQGTFQYFLNYIIDPNYLENRIEKFVSIGTVVTIFNLVYSIN